MNKKKIVVGVIFAFLLIGIASSGFIPYFGKITGTVTISAPEPEFHVPESEEQCKDEGWRSLSTLGGRLFDNQGDCISYIQTHLCEDLELDIFYDFYGDEKYNSSNKFYDFGGCVSYFSIGMRAGAGEILTFGGSGGGGGGGSSPTIFSLEDDESKNESEYELEYEILSPLNNSVFNQSSVEFSINVSISGEEVEIQNVSLLINEVINETNASRLEGVYSWIVELVDGDYNWSIIVIDSNNKSHQSQTKFFSINTTTEPEEPEPEEEATITINSPLNQTYNISEILLNVSINGEFNLSSLWYTLDYGETNITFESNETPALNLSNGTYFLEVYANNTESEEIFSSVVFSIDTIGADETILGCTDPEATNYNLEATENDESCVYDTGGE